MAYYTICIQSTWSQWLWYSFDWLCEITDNTQPQHQQQHGVYNNINSLYSFTDEKKSNSFDACAAQTQSQDIVTTFIAWIHRNITVYGRIQSNSAQWIPMKLMSYTRAAHTYAALSTKHWILFLTRQIQEVKTRHKMDNKRHRMEDH